MNVVWRAAEIIKQIGEITYYRSVVLADVEYAIDDGVYMWSGKKDSPYIGQIKSIWRDKWDQPQLGIRWYYKPTDVADVIERKCGTRELFPSDVMDENPAHLATGKVRVLPYKKFKALSAKEQRDPNVYYFKEYYKATEFKFCDKDPVRKEEEFVKEDFPIELREYWLHFFSQQPDEWTPAKIEKYVNIFVEHEIRESSIHLLNPKFLSEVMNITIGHDILKILELRDFVLKTKKDTALNIIDDSTPSSAKRKSSIESKKKSSQQGITKTVAGKKSQIKSKIKVKKEVKVESESESSSKESSNESESDDDFVRRPRTRSRDSQRRASLEKIQEIKNKLRQDKQKTSNNNQSKESQSLTPSTDSPVIKVPTQIVKSVLAKQSLQPSTEPKGKVSERPVQRPLLQSPSKPKEAPRINTLATSNTNTNTMPQKSNNPHNTNNNNNTSRVVASSPGDVTVTTTVSPGKTKTTSPFASLDTMKDVAYKYSGATRSHVGITPVKASSFSAPRSKEMLESKLMNKAQSEPRLSSYTPLSINKSTPKKNVVLDDDSEDEKEVQEIDSTSVTPRNSPERHQVYEVEDDDVQDVQDAPEALQVQEVEEVAYDENDQAQVEESEHQEYSNLGDEYANSETQHYETEQEQVQPVPPVQPAGYYHANVGVLTGASNYSQQDYNEYSSRESHAEDKQIQPVLQQFDKSVAEKHDSRNQLFEDSYVNRFLPTSTVATADMFQVEDISPSPVRKKVLPLPQNNPLLATLQSAFRDLPNDPFVNNMYSEHSDPLRLSSESFSSQADASQVTDSQLAAILPTPMLQQQQQRRAEEEAYKEGDGQNEQMPEQEVAVNQSFNELDQSKDDIRPWQSQREVVEVQSQSQYLDDELPDELLSQLYDQYAELSQMPPQQNEPPKVIDVSSTPVHIRNQYIPTQPQPQIPMQIQETQPYYSGYNLHEKSPINTKKRKFQEMIQISSSSSLDSDEEEFSPVPIPIDSPANGHPQASAPSQGDNPSPKKKRRKQIVIDPSSPLSQFSQQPIDNVTQLSQRCSPKEFYETCSQMFFPPDHSPINVFSGFDGIGGALVALQKVGIEVAKYFVCEIDADCRQVVQMNIRKSAAESKRPPVKYVRVGPDWDITSVTKEDIERLPKITLFVAGSPCNDLSVLKKGREGLKGSQSRLFYEFVKILKWYKESHPDETPFFLFENVASMRRQDKDEISNCLGVSPVKIDAAQVSGAHRNRYYWTNIPRTGPLQASPEKQYAQFYLSQDHIALREKLNCITTRNTVQKFTDKSVEWGLDHPRYDPVLGPDGKLKPLKVSECERLLGFPSGYTECNDYSDTKRKEMLGNSFAIPVISYLLEPLKDLTEVVPNKTNVYKQQTLTQIVK